MPGIRTLLWAFLLGVLLPIGALFAGKVVKLGIVELVYGLFLCAFWLLARARRKKKHLIDHGLLAALGMLLFPWFMRYVNSTDEVLAMIIK